MSATSPRDLLVAAFREAVLDPGFRGTATGDADILLATEPGQTLLARIGEAEALRDHRERCHNNNPDGTIAFLHRRIKALEDMVEEHIPQAGVDQSDSPRLGCSCGWVDLPVKAAPSWRQHLGWTDEFAAPDAGPQEETK